jgi:hypothetical protein
MTLPASGAISISDICTEFGITPLTNIQLSGSLYRANGFTSGAVAANGIANVSNNYNIPQSGSASMSQFYSGKKGFKYVVTIASNTADYIIGSAAATAGWDTIMPIDATITLGSNVYVYATTTATAALRDMASASGPINSKFRVIIPSIAYVTGKGGAGGTADGGAGAAGGVGMTMYTAQAQVNNLGTVAGGGGGGGSGQSGTGTDGGEGSATYGGGGGGGGAGFSAGAGGGGAGGKSYNGSGGSSGSWNAGGGGGGGGNANGVSAGAGGTGGSAGNAGAGGNNGSGFSGGQSGPGGGGAAGNASTGGNISWLNTGTRLGTVA